MALVLADRVRDTTTTTGTGTVTLSGTAPTGYQNFSVVGNGNTTYYTINAGSQWEVGIGTYSSTGPTLARTTILSSSSSGSAVDFAAGTKDVFVTYPSGKSVNYDASNNVGIGTTSPSVTLDVTGDSIRLTRAANPPAFLGRQSSGTIASPTATTSGSQILALGSSGYNGSAYTSTPSAAIRLLALETFTATANGAGISFETTAIGSASSARAEVMRLDGSGNLGIGTTTPAAKLHITDQTNTAFTLNQYNDSEGALFRMYSARGTIAAPTAVTTDSVIFGTRGFGYSSAGAFGSAVVQINARAAENFTATAQGTYITFVTTTIGSATSAERMRITDAGNVGIGTTVPGYPLAVVANSGSGAVRLVGRSADGIATLEFSTNNQAATNAYIQGGTTYLLFGTSTTERMRIDSSGNVGIGTSSPTQKLDVGAGGNLLLSGASTGDQYIRVGSGRSGNGYSYIDLQGDTTYSNGLRLIRVNNGANANSNIEHRGTGALQLVTQEAGAITFFTSATERARIDSSGNVGIGTSSPGSKLDVSSSIQNIIISRSTASYAAFQRIAPTGQQAYDFYTINGVEAARITANEANFMAFATGSSATERMRINSTGLGIGTTTPSQTLDVNGNINFGATLLSGSGVSTGDCAFELGSNRSASGNAYIDFHAVAGTDQEARLIRGSGVDGAFTISNTGTGSMALYNAGAAAITFSTTAAERARIDSSGNFLVGTTAAEGGGKVVSVSTVSADPCYAARNSAGASSYFHYFINAANSAIIGSISNNANTGVLYNVTSDSRLKKNVANADDAASLIDALQVRKFDWKADGSHQRYGFVAQELLEVVPEAVHQPDDPEDIMGVDYSKLVPMLIKEVQSLRARVAQLEGN